MNEALYNQLPPWNGTCPRCGRRAGSPYRYCTRSRECRLAYARLRDVIERQDAPQYRLPHIPPEVAGGVNARGRWAVPGVAAFGGWYFRNATRYTNAQLRRAAARLHAVARFRAWCWNEVAEHQRRVLSCPPNLGRLRPSAPSLRRWLALPVNARYTDRPFRRWLQKLETAGPLALIDTRGTWTRTPQPADVKLWRRLSGLVARGASIARAWRKLTPIAKRRGLPWVSQRTAQHRLRTLRPVLRKSRAVLAGSGATFRKRSPALTRGKTGAPGRR